MNAILQFILKYVLDFVFGKVQRYLSKTARVKKTKDVVNAQAQRLKAAIDKAYDGTEITKEQSKEIVEAARALMSDY